MVLIFLDIFAKITAVPYNSKYSLVITDLKNSSG